MEKPFTNPLALEWLIKADADLVTANREFRARKMPNYDAACFHAQQCVEKLLKAMMIHEGVVPPRIGDDADFRGDTVVIWIGTNDVLQGGSAAPVAARIMEAARAKADLKKSFTTESTEDTEVEVGQRLAGQAGAAFSNPSASELARDSENTSLTRSASGHASSLGTSYPLPVTRYSAEGAYTRSQLPVTRYCAGGANLRPGDSADGDLVGGGEGTECPDSIYMRLTGKTPEEVFPILKKQLAYA
jgi:hypothetical protein